jgi:hypothetical protein
METGVGADSTPVGFVNALITTEVRPYCNQDSDALREPAVKILRHERVVLQIRIGSQDPIDFLDLSG